MEMWISAKFHLHLNNLVSIQKLLVQEGDKVQAGQVLAVP